MPVQALERLLAAFDCAEFSHVGTVFRGGEKHSKGELRLSRYDLCLIGRGWKPLPRVRYR